MRPATETRVAAAGFSYRVERSARRVRTMQLLVDTDGAVVVRTPLRVSMREIAAMVDARAAWVLKRQAAVAATPRPPARTFASGETLFVDGFAVVIDLRVAPGTRGRVGLVGESLTVRAPGESVTARATAIERWYRARTRARAEELVRHWSPTMGVGPAGLIVKEQRRRWGSCASSGVLRLNWRLSMLPPECFEYVVVHELAHLKQPNHSFLFWMEVAAALPDFAARKATVRAFEARIDW